MKLFKYVASLLLVGSSSLSAIQLTNDLDVSGGYRHDKVQVTTHSDVATGVPAFAVLNQKNDLIARNLNVWQIGLKGRAVMPQLDCLCSYGYLNDILSNFYLTGHAYWGKAFGQKHFSSNLTNEQPVGGIFTCGNFSRYRTDDYQIALGYLIDVKSWFCLDYDIGIGIFGGYSWDRQKYKAREGDTIITTDASGIGTGFVNDPFYSLGNVRWDQQWKGALLGAELFYNFDNFLINLGYEYHFAHYHGTSKVGPAAVLLGGSSVTAHSRNAYGNVVYLNGTYVLCDGWEVGAGFQFSDFRSRHGRYNFSGVAPLDVTPDGARGVFQSYAITANLGYSF